MSTQLNQVDLPQQISPQPLTSDNIDKLTESDTIIQVKNLQVHFPVKTGLLSRISRYVRAVDNISFTIESGKTLALVGESGCGKTTAGRAILQLVPVTSGSICFHGEEIVGCTSKKMRQLRRRMQIVFQDPYSSLNPRMTVSQIVSEGWLAHRLYHKSEYSERVTEILKLVGLPVDVAGRYPHEFSGGQRQRVGIARALAVNPEFIVCDEAVSALDVSVQAQIINLLTDLQQERGLTYLFIAHDLALVRMFAHKTAVMYLGAIMEIGESATIFANPVHPYTQALLAAAPGADLELRQKHQVLSSDIPRADKIPPGCRFHPRCPVAMERCKTVSPEEKILSDGRKVSCHLVVDSASS